MTTIQSNRQPSREPKTPEQERVHLKNDTPHPGKQRPGTPIPKTAVVAQQVFRGHSG